MRSFFKENKFEILGLFSLVFISYIFFLGNEFVSDDIPGFLQNSQLKELSYIFTPFGFIRNTLHYFAYLVGGVNPPLFRLVNILFHLGSVILVYAILKETINKKAALIASLIVAVHPIFIEAVTWISGGAYSQYSFFILLSFYLYIKNRYIFSVLAFFGALQSHGVALIYPGILITYHITQGALFKSIKKLVPFVILSIIWFISGVFIIQNRIDTLTTSHYQEFGMDNPLIYVPISVTNYLQLIFFPKDLTIYHTELSTQTWEFVLRAGVFVGLLVSIVVLYLKKQKWIAFWLMVFLISLAPTLSPLRISWTVAERYVYLGAIGIICAFSIILEKLSSKKTTFKEPLLVLLGIIILVLMVRTIMRNNDWKTADNLWLSAEYTSPSSPNNHNNLGDLYGRRGDMNRAIEEFKKAIELKPNYGDAYHNLGNVYAQTNQRDLAIQNYKEAIKYNPGLWQSYQNIAALYYKDKDYKGALDFLMQAQKTDPQNINIYNSLGIVYLDMKEKQMAKQMFETALRYDPQNQVALQGITEASR